MTSTRTRERSQPTAAQITRLYTLASRAGWKREAVHGEIMSRYGAESTKQLTTRQYEQFTAFLEGIIRAQDQGPQSSADAAFHHPRVHDKRGAEGILAREWPALVTGEPTLAANIVEVLDCMRLWRKKGTISPRLLVVELQKMRRLPPDVLAAAVEIYLGGHTLKNEQYFFGIARRIKREIEHEKNAAKRKDEIDKRKRAAAERELDEVLAAAGPSPAEGLDRCVCSHGRLSYRRDEASQPRTIPCPWCQEGLARLRLALSRGDRLGRVDWDLVREQAEQFLERAAEQP